ncbi:hypothetical protein [Paraflavitalea speifideaquila]|nr:hypothetical protein [Paraflavitalea speifideiaquila]
MKKQTILSFFSLLFAVSLLAQSTPSENGHFLFNMMPNYKVDPSSKPILP